MSADAGSPESLLPGSQTAVFRLGPEVVEGVRELSGVGTDPVVRPAPS